LRSPPKATFPTRSLPPSLSLPTKIWPQAGISNPEGPIFRPFTYIKKLKSEGPIFRPFTNTKKLKSGRAYFRTLHLHKETQIWKGLFSDPSPTQRNSNLEGPIFIPFTYIKKQAWISCYLSG
jgi:hypothetical protein